MVSLIAITGGFAVGIFLNSVFVLGWPAAAFSLIIAALFGIAMFIHWNARSARGVRWR